MIFIKVWSEEDKCFIGTCPELMDSGIHGNNALKVFRELCVACDEVIEIYEEDGVDLPEPRNIVLKAA